MQELTDWQRSEPFAKSAGGAGDQPPIAPRIRRNGDVLEHRTSRSEGRRGVGVLVGVDADHDVEVFCQHGHRSLTRE